MKKILFLLSIALVLLTGCDPNDEPAKKITIDPLATVDIKPDPKGWSGLKSTSEHLSPLEIVEQTTVMQYYNPNVPLFPDAKIWERGFDIMQRDLNPDDPKLKMWATDIITKEGELMPEFIEGRNIILLKFDQTVANAPRDTIGYIPNATISAADAAIKTAYNNGDVDAIYQIFNTAFTFLPITGAEYKALKEAGKQ